jgi:hypothetical protein
MGIFFDTCDALIDPETGRALTGEALEQAQNTPKWPRCGNKVSKRARFCNACGKPAPGGWWKCPGCGKWIGNDSRFCPHCDQPLYPEDRTAVAGGVWRKEAIHFAQRFEIGDIRRLLSNKLQIQEGTCAVLMDSGRVSGILEAGSHNPDSLARKINYFGNPPPRSVVLIDIGEIVVPIHVEGLRTSESFPIEFYGEVMLRFKGDEDAAKAFITNILGEGRSCTFSDLADNFIRAVRIAIDEMCVASTLDDLVRDPERRIRLQERMTSRLSGDLAAAGLELVRVSSAEFTGDEYEEYAEKLGKVDIERRETEYRAAMRQMADKEAMDEYKDADTLRQYKEMIDHEYRVSSSTREREFELLKREWEHDDIRYTRLLELENQEHFQTIERNDTEHKILIDKLKAEARWWEQVGDAETAAKVRSIAVKQEWQSEIDWLEVKRIKQDLDLARKTKTAEIIKSLSVEQMVAFEDDPSKREDLLRMIQIQRSVNMSAEQLLAEQGKEALNERLVAKMEELFRHASEREDRNLSKMLEPATEAARHPSHNTGPFIK